MLVKNNIPLALADELTPLFRDVFHDSPIAKGFSSRRMKTACLINGAIAPFYHNQLLEKMKSGPFSLSIDGSTDTGIEKMNPLTVRVFDATVSCQFLDMCMSSSSTAEGIFCAMQDALNKMEFLGRTALESVLIIAL